MSALWPDESRISMLQFRVGFPDLRVRLLLAAGCFTVGLAIFTVADGVFGAFGLFLVLLGHVPLLVRGQTTAPGGATPAHEEIWAPVEDAWLARVQDLEERGKRWDATPWEISNGKGCLTLLALLAGSCAGAIVLDVLFSTDALDYVVYAAPVLFVPLWFNGMRTVWNPSELRKKGEALELARSAAERLAKGDFDVVPLLALRQGRRGSYPVDARLMLRPTVEDASGFLGVQIQVAMNNVKGTDYPYLYAVVLGKDAFPVPAKAPKRRTVDGTDLVFERGEGEGARYLVVRQHADTGGGWHTEKENIAAIVTEALGIARKLRLAGGGGPAA